LPECLLHCLQNVYKTPRRCANFAYAIFSRQGCQVQAYTGLFNRWQNHVVLFRSGLSDRGHGEDGNGELQEPALPAPR